MRRILFQWRGITVYSYPAMLYIGLVAGVMAGNAAANATGLNPFRTFVATLLLIMPGLIGARLLYVATNWKHYRQSPGRIWNRNEGGQAMYGGLPIMLLLSVPLLAALQLEFSMFWDVAAFTILVGMFFARIGCFLNGCCAGRPSRSRLSLYLPDYRGVWETRIPVQCLEAVWTLVLLGLAIAVRRWLPFAGALFLVVCAGYGTGRLALEPMREEAREKGGITSSSWISIAVVTVSVATLIARWPH